MNAISNWLDDRTGYRKFVHDALYENIPGGSRWRYVWGSTLVFTFTVQAITGIFLWMSYSPSSQTAWESVYYIQHEMQFGWLLRGVHHFTAQMMVVLLALHLMQVIIDGAYRAPREVNFWLGLILMQIVLGLSLTGYLLPWDQKGYWATQVATKLSGIIPGIGPSIQRLIVGGPEYGHHTLTRFFAMHAGVLPGLLILFLVAHIYVFRRHGVKARNSVKPDTSFWPDQVLKDAVACLGVMLVVLLLCIWRAPHNVDELRTLAGSGRLGDVLGADLGAPADGAAGYPAARPEWYFLFLFQFLKYFDGPREIYGAVVIPGAVFGIMFLMPFIGRWKLGHFFNIGYIFCLLAGIGVLTWQAMDQDRKNPEYTAAVAGAESNAKRIVELIHGQKGISVTGARELLRHDPKTQGPHLFAMHCAACHRFDGHNGVGEVPTEPATASDLGTFGTREGISAFIKDPDGQNHFGPTVNGAFNGQPVGTRFTEGEMADWAKTNVPKMKPQDLQGVTELLVSLGSPRRGVTDPDPQQVAIGRNFFEKGAGEATACADCHHLKVGDANLGEGGTAPDLTGYGSEAWLKNFILHPDAPQNYGEKNAMRRFDKQISDKDLDILVKWMRQDWYEPEGAAAVQPKPATNAEAASKAATEGEATKDAEPKAEAEPAEPEPKDEPKADEGEAPFDPTK